MVRTVYVMAKAPVLGTVKTRLAADIGALEAMRFYRRILKATMRALAADGRWQTVLAVTPDAAARTAALWPHDLQHGPEPQPARQGQGPGSLGARMARLFRTAPAGPVLVTGSDIPGVTPHLIAQAFADLGNADVTIGPSMDGGYWLIGMAARARHINAVGDSLFAHVRWSSPHALEDTLSNLKGRRVTLTTTLADVDTGDDFERWRASA